MTRTLLAAAAVSATLLTSLPAAAQFQKPEDAVKYRKAGMTMIAAHFGRIGAMAAGRAPFDAAAANANAEVLTHLAALPFAGFVEGTAGTDKGAANAKVWSERAKFDEAAKKMQDELAKLAAAAKTNNLDNLKAAAGGVGGSCKGCHDNFRNQ